MGSPTTCGAVLLAGLLTITAQSQVLYCVTILDPVPGGMYSPRPTDINDQGHVTGDGNTADQNVAFLWRGPGDIISLGVLPNGYRSDAEALNNLDHVVGRAGVRDSTGHTFTRAFFWSAETGMLDLGSLGGPGRESVALAVNDFDQVVGRSQNNNIPFFWDSENGMIGLGTPPGTWDFGSGTDINNQGEVVCCYVNVTSDRACRWDAENGLRRIPRFDGVGSPVSADAINDHGQIVGTLAGPLDNGAYLWDPVAGHTMLGYLFDDDATWPADLNEHGQVVGVSWRLCCQQYESWIWDAQHRMRNLEDLLDPCYAGAYEVIGVRAINNLGQIAGYVETVLISAGAVLTPYIAADPDLDGDTDLTDLATVLANFGRTQVPSFAEGDIDEDFDVDLDDLAHVLVNFGNHCP